ncbi:hypothetical protein BGZ65_011452 [Modicella reniformis]|uniref:Uncharacterized protein n=1 Tax=Modicella reniformis TaxID=1440133 RepID=A0A9P6IR71_9FUNG|nr:hypothetical protein BGZ65_011452 [Modicella reniformis]
MSNVASHHGGTPAGSFGSSALSSIPESGAGTFEPGFHRSHSSPTSAGSSRPPKTTPRFFRINKKRFSGDSQSLFMNKDGRGNNVTEEGCVVNTALLQKQPKNSVELTARSGSTTNLAGLWSGGITTGIAPATINTNGSTSPQTPTDHLQSTGVPGTPNTPGWKQGWIPEEEAEDPPMPSLLTTSRNHNIVNHASGHSPLLTPMARYKLQHQDGSSSAPSSTTNLAADMREGGSNGNSGSGFVTSADERDEWSADGGEGDDEGDGSYPLQN